MATKKTVGSHSKSGSVTSVPKSKPQAVKPSGKAANAKPTQASGGF